MLCNLCQEKLIRSFSSATSSILMGEGSHYDIKFYNGYESRTSCTVKSLSSKLFNSKADSYDIFLTDGLSEHKYHTRNLHV